MQEQSDKDLQAGLEASIADQEKKLEDAKAALRNRTRVDAPAASTSTSSTSTSTSRAIRPTGKGKGAEEADHNRVRATGGRGTSDGRQRADVPAAAGSGRGADVPRPGCAAAAAGRGRRGRGRGRGRSDDDEEQAPILQRTVVESDEPAPSFMGYMLNPGSQSAVVLADYVLPCKPGSEWNQRALDPEFRDVLARKITEDGRSPFTQRPVALLINEESVPKIYIFIYIIDAPRLCYFIVYLCHNIFYPLSGSSHIVVSGRKSSNCWRLVTLWNHPVLSMNLRLP